MVYSESMLYQTAELERTFFAERAVSKESRQDAPRVQDIADSILELLTTHFSLEKNAILAELNISPDSPEFRLFIRAYSTLADEGIICVDYPNGINRNSPAYFSLGGSTR